MSGKLFGRLFGRLFELGVTQVTEKWHGLLEVELILEGNFVDEDIAWCIYENSPMMHSMQGKTKVTIHTGYGYYTTAFTRC